MPVNNDVLAALLANAQSREQPAAPRRRRRGGLAGIWDRNRGVIGSIAGAGLATLIPGGAAIAPYIGGALGGAAARGRLDERAIGDAFMGAGGVAAGKSIGGGISRILGRRAASAVTNPMANLGNGNVLGGVNPVADVAARNAAAGQAAGGVVPAAQGLGRLGRIGNFIEKNPTGAGMMLQGAAGILGSQSERRIAEERMALERERAEQERRRRENIAGLLLPLYRQQAQRFTP